MDGLFVGRFQPFHLGHLHAIRYTLTRTDRLWIGIGSSNLPPGEKNPFSVAERREMILASLGPEELGRVRIFDIPDLNDHARWAENTKAIVPDFGAVFTNDETTSHIYSRQGFAVFPIPFEDRDRLSGTEIRRRMASGVDWQSCVPDGTRDVLSRSGAFDRLEGCSYK